MDIYGNLYSSSIQFNFTNNRMAINWKQCSGNRNDNLIYKNKRTNSEPFVSGNKIKLQVMPKSKKFQLNLFFRILVVNRKHI